MEGSETILCRMAARLLPSSAIFLSLLSLKVTMAISLIAKKALIAMSTRRMTICKIVLSGSIFYSFLLKTEGLIRK